MLFLVSFNLSIIKYFIDMKSVFSCFALLIVLLISGCSSGKESKNAYTINGVVNIDSLNGKYVYLFSSVQKMDSAIASAEIKDNKFHISNTTLVHPFSAPLVVGGADGELLHPYIGSSLVIEPGRIKVKIYESGVTEVAGTPLNDMFYKCEYATIEYDSLCAELSRKDANGEEKRVSVDSLKVIRANTIYEALVKNLNWEVTNEVIGITYLYMNSEQLEDIIMHSHPDIRDQRMFDQIEEAANTSVGCQYVDMAFNTLDGDSVMLSNYMGKAKYTLIEFWASWCGPCIRTIPDLKEMYDMTLREEFDVVAISLDKSVANWKNATEKHNIEWSQLSSLKVWDCESVSKYGLTFIPATVLVDENGVIVARNPSMDELRIYLE